MNFLYYLGNSFSCNIQYKPHVTKFLMILKNGTGIYKALKSLFLVLIISNWNFLKEPNHFFSCPLFNFYLSLYNEICRPHLMNKYFSFFWVSPAINLIFQFIFYYSISSFKKRVQQIDMPQNGFGLKEKDKIITYTTVHTSPKSTNFSNYTFLF